MNELLLALASRLNSKQWRIATAESCTGGLIASYCTDLAGSSTWFDRGFVTYANQAKHDMLGVPLDMLAQHGAVSEQVACAMALGTAYRSNASATLAVTGVAGPSGGSPEKPVGTVWVAWHAHGQLSAEKLCLIGNRQQIKHATAVHALQGLLDRISIA